MEKRRKCREMKKNKKNGSSVVVIEREGVIETESESDQILPRFAK